MVTQHEFIYVRYFLVSMAFLMILISFLLSRLYQRSPMGKAICLLFLVAYFLANGWHIMTLCRDGTGDIMTKRSALWQSTPKGRF